MPTLEAPSIAPDIADAVRRKLHEATAPLKLEEVTKGLPKARKVKPAEQLEAVRKVLDEEVRLGKAFRYSSAKNEQPRFWARDEKQVLRDKAVELAVSPQALSALKKALGNEVKGVDGAFVEAVVRELIRDDRLFEHPPRKKNGSPLFGASPPLPSPAPPPPLEQAKHKKAVDKLAESCRKLLAATGVTTEVLLVALRGRLGEPSASLSPVPPVSVSGMPAKPDVDPTRPNPDLDELILKAVAHAPVVSLAELRRELPLEFRGRAFDEAVLRLAEQERVIVSRDADPARFSAMERSDYVQDGGSIFTTIFKRS